MLDGIIHIKESDYIYDLYPVKYNIIIFLSKDKELIIDNHHYYSVPSGYKK